MDSFRYTLRPEVVFLDSFRYDKKDMLSWTALGTLIKELVFLDSFRYANKYCNNRAGNLGQL